MASAHQRFSLGTVLIVSALLVCLIYKSSNENTFRSPHQTKVAVCFFGLTRSLDVTVESIRRAIIDPLIQAEHDIEIFLHTYNASAVNNPRSEEINAVNNWEDWRLLQPDKMSWDAADEVKDRLYYPHEEAYLLHGDPWDEDHHTSLKNLILQLYSLNRVTDFWRHRAKSFDVIIYARMDVWFFNKISMRDLHAAKGRSETCFAPALPWGAGLDWTNDMFAFGHPQAMLIWATRLHSALQFSKDHRLHSESFLWNVLRNSSVEVQETPLLFARVRATKEIWAVPTEQDGRLVVPHTDAREVRPGLVFNRSELGLLELIPVDRQMM